MECISDEQASKLKQYVRNGGTLYITGEAGITRHTVSPAITPAFEELRSIEATKLAAATDAVETISGKGRIFFAQNGTD